MSEHTKAGSCNGTQNSDAEEQANKASTDLLEENTAASKPNEASPSTDKNSDSHTEQLGLSNGCIAEKQDSDNDSKLANSEMSGAGACGDGGSLSCQAIVPEEDVEMGLSPAAEAHNHCTDEDIHDDDVSMNTGEATAGSSTPLAVSEPEDAVSSPQHGSVSSDSDAEGNQTSSTEEAVDSDGEHVDDSDSDYARLISNPLMRHLFQRHVASPYDDDSSDDAQTTQSPISDEEDKDIKHCFDDIDPWKPLPSLARRELGYAPNVYCTQQFKRSVYSSIGITQRLALEHKLEGHLGCVNALNFNSTGNLLASGSDDLKIIIWDWKRNRQFVKYDSGHSSNVFQCKFLPLSGDCHVVSCARDGAVRLASLSTTGVCRATKRLAQHKDSAHKVAMIRDSPYVFYSSGEDGVVFQIDIREDKPTKLCTVKEDGKRIGLHSIDVNPYNSSEFCVAARDKYLRVYDKRRLNEGIPMKKYYPHDMNAGNVYMSCAVYNYDGSEILGSLNDDDIYLYDMNHSDGASYIKKYQGHRNNATMKSVNFYGPHSEFIVSGSDCSNVFFWEKQSEKIVHYYHADKGGVVNMLEPHPFDPCIATSGLDADVKIWSPRAPERTKLKGLSKVMRRNARERARDRDNDGTDSQIWWMLMQRFRRAARRNWREEYGGSGSSDSSDSDDDAGYGDNGGNDSDDDDDDANEPDQPMQCAQS